MNIFTATTLTKILDALNCNNSFTNCNQVELEILCETSLDCRLCNPP